jgi:hypothetical protein
VRFAAISAEGNHSTTADVVAGPDSYRNWAPSRITGGQGNARGPKALSAGPSRSPGLGTGRRTMQQRLHWLDYDPVALAVLVIGIGMIELLALLM